MPQPIPVDMLDGFDLAAWEAFSYLVPDDVAATVIVVCRSTRDGSTRVASGRTLHDALEALRGVLRSG